MDKDKSEPPAFDGQTSPGCCFVGKDSHGNWVVQDADHRRGGLFTNRAAALKFAREESGHRHPALVMVPDVLELDMGEKTQLLGSSSQHHPSYRHAA